MFTFNNTKGNDNLKAFKKKIDGMKIILFDLVFLCVGIIQ